LYYVCAITHSGFEVEDGKASVLLNTAVYGDVTIVVYHARSAFGGKVQGKVCYRLIVLDVALCASVYLLVHQKDCLKLRMKFHKIF